MNSRTQLSRLYDQFCTFVSQHNLIRKGGDNIVVCWSGGKDSTALLHLLLDYQTHEHFDLSVVFVPFPTEIVYADGRDETLAYWEKQGGVHINIVSPLVPREHSLREVPRHLTCVECKKIRRSALVDRFFRNCDLEHTVIATGHTSWDLAAYLLEITISSVSQRALSPEIASDARHLEITNRFLPHFAYPNGPAIIRPLLGFNEQDVFEVLLGKNVPYPFSLVPVPCPWRDQRKRILENYFRSMGLVFSFERLLEYANQTYPPMHRVAAYQRLPFEKYLL